jgi:hypothetical protein
MRKACRYAVFTTFVCTAFMHPSSVHTTSCLELNYIEKKANYAELWNTLRYKVLTEDEVAGRMRTTFECVVMATQVSDYAVLVEYLCYSEV